MYVGNRLLPVKTLISVTLQATTLQS